MYLGAYGIGISKSTGLVYDEENQCPVPGKVVMTGGSLSYADAMKETNVVTHTTHLDTFNKECVADGYIGTFDTATGCITVGPVAPKAE